LLTGVVGFGRKPTGKNHLKDLGVEGRILKWIFKKLGERRGLE
jgi:hypothetical protein